MTMAVDSSQQRYLNNFDHMNSYSHHAAAAAPHFTNPWTTQSGGSQHTQQHQYGSMQQPQPLGGIDSLRHHQPSHQTQPSQQQHNSHSHHAPLPQPTPQHHAAPHHAQHSPVSQHSQQPHQHQHQQTQQQAPRQPVQAPPRPPSQQPLPPAPTMHRNGSMSYPTGTGGMTVTAGGSPHSRDYRSDLLIATTTSGYDNIAAYSAPTASPIHPTTNAAAAAYATATGATPYDQMGYAPATTMRGAPPAPTGSVSAFGLDAAAADAARRFSQDASAAQDNRRGFQDALEASQGMMSLNSQDTPRPLGFPGGQQPGLARSARGSADSYGFPSTAHSTSSSVSSQSFGGFYTTGGSSIDSQSNISDYSGSDIEQVSSRRQHHMMHGGLPPHGPGHNMHSAPQTHRPPPFVGSVPPAPQSMMGQFSSKMTNSAQKKHKCKVCDKRFTRPSSLQTHMYSHTGEKPFRCEVPGCGRNFSVVSNLRRHRKVHKDLTPSEAGSDDHHNSE